MAGAPGRIRAVQDTRRARHAVSILEAGLEAAEPGSIVPRFVSDGVVHMDSADIHLDGYDGVYTVAFGKAADAMSRAVARATRVDGGMVVVPRGSRPLTRGKRFSIYRADHPRPGRASVVAAKAILKFLDNRRRNDFVLFLVSGGASALLALPYGITIQDKMYTTDALLRCGATISEINCVRKHISSVKGGRLLSALPCEGASLVMSDVEGDDPGTIASGTTYMDITTFGQALDIIQRYDLVVPPGVSEQLQRGAAGELPETPKSALIPHCVIANNSTCMEAMSQRATHLGYHITATQYYGPIQDTTDSILHMMDEGQCMVFGGEPQVRVTGSGRGGRCQEMVLRMAMHMDSRMLVACMGSDGVDGNTTAAGAMHEGPASHPQKAASCLERNDSHAYFARHGGLIKTGHTGTNLSDIGVALTRP